ncbi:hypothetical protein COL75_15475 [Bacillus wiedmannii]|uniref:AIPR family protein n=1 Tax=Bacillus TaxID=1386 RepID=UPI000BF7D13C|nr:MULTISPECIES: AIPR family protein [Bacillus]PFZ02650.1 hypothetical protein COL75_15475 [Bacillus wiedmannii]
MQERVDIKYEDYMSITLEDNLTRFFVLVKCKNHKRLPNEGNIRQPESLYKDDIYKGVLQTLEKNPNVYIDFHGGIALNANKVSIDKVTGVISLYFNPKSGIKDGGHTQEVMLNAQQKLGENLQGMYLLKVKEADLTQAEMAMHSEKTNLRKPVKKYCFNNKRGDFELIKQSMEDRYRQQIIWYTGCKTKNKNAIEVTDLIAIINLFNVETNNSVYSDRQKEPNASATNKGQVFRNWEKNKKLYEHVVPLINDILVLKEYIELNFHLSKDMRKLNIIKGAENNKKAKRTVFLNEKPGFIIPRQFLYPILASFRANIKYDKDKEIIGWYENPVELYQKCSSELFRKLSYAFQKSHHENINLISRDRNLWGILYLIVDRHINKKGSWNTYEINN